MNIQINKAFLMERLKEPSTWRGLIVLATGLGAHISPDMAEGIIATGMVVAGAVGVAAPDKNQEQADG